MVLTYDEQVTEESPQGSVLSPQLFIIYDIIDDRIASRISKFTDNKIFPNVAAGINQQKLQKNLQ